jgi:hypothetical protein
MFVVADDLGDHFRLGACFHVTYYPIFDWEAVDRML